MERETGIEPATNSLEGCDSTTELLPPPRRATFASRRYGGQARGTMPAKIRVPQLQATARLTRPIVVARPRIDQKTPEGSLPSPPTSSSAPTSPARWREVGGEGRVRTSVARRRQVYSLLRLTALPPPRYHVRSKTGYSRAPCLGLSRPRCRLYFGVRASGVPEDPLRLIQGKWRRGPTDGAGGGI